MAALSIQVPYPVFYDRDGQPLDNGNIYIGVANLDPVTNPLQVYYDDALTITASQPLKTSNGYVYRNGTPAQLYVNATDFSITVNDSKDLFVYSFPEGTGISPNASGIAFTGFKGQVGTVADLADADGSNWIGYTPAGTGAVARSAQEKMRDSVSVKDFGAVGDGVADDTAALQAAIDYAGAQHTTLIIPAGKYKTTSTLYIDQSMIIYGEGSPSSGPGASTGYPLATTQGSVIQYTGITTAIQVSKSRAANPRIEPVFPGYIYETQIHNLRIEVPAACQKGLYIFHAVNSYFFNITLWGAQSTGGTPNGAALLRVEAGVNNIYELININGVGSYGTPPPNETYFANYGAFLQLGWNNEGATTTIFRRCYFQYCNVGVFITYTYQFEDCIFERCGTGIFCDVNSISTFSRGWWEGNTVFDIVFQNADMSIKDSRINSYNRQQYFATAGGLSRLQFDNVLFYTDNANPYIFGVNPLGDNIFNLSGATPKTVSFNNCVFSPNTTMGNIYNNPTVNKIQIQNMSQETLTFAASAVAANATPTMNGSSGFANYRMPEAGDVIGINIFGSSAISAGTFDIVTYINGVAIPDLSFPAIGAVTSFPFQLRIQPLKAPFAKGDVISVYFHTNASWAPVNNVCYEVIVAYGPSGELA